MLIMQFTKSILKLQIKKYTCIYSTYSQYIKSQKFVNKQLWLLMLLRNNYLLKYKKCENATQVT